MLARLSPLSHLQPTQNDQPHKILCLKQGALLEGGDKAQHWSTCLLLAHIPPASTVHKSLLLGLSCPSTGLGILRHTHVRSLPMTPSPPPHLPLNKAAHLRGKIHIAMSGLLGQSTGSALVKHVCPEQQLQGKRDVTVSDN